LPKPASLNDTQYSPVVVSRLGVGPLMKWGLCARTVVAMKPRAIMVQVRMLNFFIGLLLIIFCWFLVCLVLWFRKHALGESGGMMAHCDAAVYCILGHCT